MTKTTLALILVVALLSVMLVYALVTRTIQHSITIVASEAFQLYQDETCTMPLTSIAWGSTGRNVVLNKDYWIKSLAEVPVQVSWNVTGLPSGVTLSMSFNSFGWTQGQEKALPVGTVYNGGLTLSLSDSAQFGTFSFTQYFNGKQ